MVGRVCIDQGGVYSLLIVFRANPALPLHWIHLNHPLFFVIPYIIIGTGLSAVYLWLESQQIVFCILLKIGLVLFRSTMGQRWSETVPLFMVFPIQKQFT
jgi:hypothetical protein